MKILATKMMKIILVAMRAYDRKKMGFSTKVLPLPYGSRKYPATELCRILSS